MKEEKQVYKPVHLTPEYHRKLSIFAINKGVTKKKAVEDLLDAAFTQEFSTPEHPQKEIV